MNHYSGQDVMISGLGLYLAIKVKEKLCIKY